MAVSYPKPTDRRFKDIAGQRFGKWLVLFLADRRASVYFWQCRCDCGKERVVSGESLRRGNSKGCKSCGKLIHGHGGSRALGTNRQSPEYRIWTAMIQRCENTKSGGYPHYGAKGIKVCGRWRESFEAFLEDMGPKPSKRHSIDRIDNNGWYSPENCRWATQKQQMRNMSRNRLIEFDGRIMCLSEWADHLGFGQKVLSDRLNKLGWTAQEALTTPIGGKRHAGTGR